MYIVLIKKINITITDLNNPIHKYNNRYANLISEAYVQRDQLIVCP